MMQPATTPEFSTAGDAAIPLHLITPEGLDSALARMPAQQSAWARGCGFAARPGQVLILPGPDGAPLAVLAGWAAPQPRPRTRFALAGIAAALPPGDYRIASRLEPDLAAQSALGWLLNGYRFERYRTSSTPAPPRLVPPAGIDPARLLAEAEGVFLTRDLINTPANDMGPAELQEAVRRLALRHKARISTIEGDDLLRENLPLIHAVGRASDRAPRLIDLIWGDVDAPRVTLVGKGVCFDTGGLNLKPGSSMGLMKKDMGGAATAIGLAHMIMALGLRLRLRLLIPAVENSVSAGAFRPGDILTSRKGLSIEINNTDAEGRLVLADALTLADEEDPDLILCMATLTGAARVALGPEVMPYFTDDAALARALDAAAVAQSDPLWRLPLWPGYEADIEPGIADLDNAPSGGMAGAITAALFLRRFVDPARAFAHFDIYGWTPKPQPARPKGGECQGARAMLAALEARFG